MLYSILKNTLTLILAVSLFTVGAQDLKKDLFLDRSVSIKFVTKQDTSFAVGNRVESFYPASTTTLSLLVIAHSKYIVYSDSTGAVIKDELQETKADIYRRTAVLVDGKLVEQWLLDDPAMYLGIVMEPKQRIGQGKK